jgi:hypothetical protein
MALLQATTMERIRAEARSITPLRTLLLVLASGLFAVGWVAARAFGVFWTGFSWTAAAIKVGYQSGKADGGGS